MNGAGVPGLFRPEEFDAKRPCDIVRKYPFATLTTSMSEDICATSVPLFFQSEARNDLMVGHLARRNPHATALRAKQRALAVFSGPNAYVSPAWYVDKPDVPTWNYIAAHVRGTLEPIDDAERTRAVLVRTVDASEQIAGAGWTLRDAEQERVDALLPHVRAFYFFIDRIEGIERLSQRHPPGDRARVAAALRAQTRQDAVEIALLIEAALEQN